MPYGNDFHAPKVNVHEFAMIPRAEIPRSSFRMQSQHKTTINASLLIPVYLQEILPGDSFNVTMTAFVRLSTPLFPLLDNMQLESFFFFVPCRLVWTHWYKFMGEQLNPSDSISFTIPTLVPPAAGFAVNSIFDYFGLPTTGQAVGNAGGMASISCLPLRAYNLICQEWFRDENLMNALLVGSTGSSCQHDNMDDGPDPLSNYSLANVCKRHDYFTSCLPWTQKGGVPVSIPLGTSATVKVSNTNLVTGAQPNAISFLTTAAGAVPTASVSWVSGGGGNLGPSSTAATAIAATVYPSNLYADLSTATAATINQLRLSFQTQKLLERDARGGTRYTEIVRSHFGVVSPDMRLQRPEYLGGGKTPVNITPVPQTGQTGLTGGTSPLGTLAAVGTGVATHGFRSAFTEHGYILGLVTVRADQIYQQGLRRLWSRSTRYDFYFPVFAMLGEQTVTNQEIYCTGTAPQDGNAFGYQERWAEYRYHPSFTSGFFRSTSPTPLDAWHLGQKYTALPALNNTFIIDQTTVILQRNLALGASSNNQQFLCDFFFDQKVARPMPMYSVPGLIDHF